MSDDKFDDLLRREAKGYRAGDKPPADAMWQRIERDVSRAIRPRGVVRYWPWLASGVGIAAALVIGVAIGRRSVTGPVAPPVAATPVGPAADSARNAQMLGATMSHLVQAEAFLTEVRADLKAGRRDPERAVRSRHLLARTRLLIANQKAGPLAVSRLLQDLELVLAEISALPDTGTGRTIDARLLDERLRAGTVIPRIRTILPSPSGGDDF